MTETWFSAQGDEAKTVELAPNGFDVKSFHFIRDLVAVELPQYTNLFWPLTSYSKQILILLLHCCCC